MITFFLLFSFVLGAVIGSFLNVVALRYGTKKNLGGRSGCMSCGHKLQWFELFPVLSFLLLRGKCLECKSKISIQYPLVEFSTGILFALTFYKYIRFLDVSSFAFLGLFAFVALVFSVLTVIVVYDFRHKMIPDGLVFTFIILAFVRLFLDWGFSGVFSFPGILDLLAGPIVAFPFVFLWLVSHGRWIGFGDAKLALGIGWFLGLAGGISAIALGFWLGTVGILIVFLLSKFGIIDFKVSRKTEIPFAPFLILGLIFVFFFQFDFFYIKDLMMYVS